MFAEILCHSLTIKMTLETWRRSSNLPNISEKRVKNAFLFRGYSEVKRWRAAAPGMPSLWRWCFRSTGWGSGPGVGLVEMLCASPEEEGEREWEKKGKRHYIKSRWSLSSIELKVLLSINHTRNQFSSYYITDFRKKGIWKEEKCKGTQLRYLVLGVCSENWSVLPFHV